MYPIKSRLRLVLGNWKMFGNLVTNAKLLNQLRNAKIFNYCEVGICVPFPYLFQVSKTLMNSRISWGVQDISLHEQGAYTGEVSGKMLKDFNCRWTLVGHSERRLFHGETNEIVVGKIQAALLVNLTPVVCIGETLNQYNDGSSLSVINSQLEPILSLGQKAVSKIVIAYEPIWAIGNKTIIDPERIQKIHENIRESLYQINAGHIRILYGGNVKISNAIHLFSMPDIDGALIGRVSLIAKDFLKIASI